MSAKCKADPELMDKGEEELWEMINRYRCKIVQKLYPERLTPYLRQAGVLDEMDEEEILHCAKFSTRMMKMSRLLDLLHNRGKNGAIAFLESLIFTNPEMYRKITGKEASMDFNSFSKLIDSSQLSIFLMQTISSLQEELLQEKQVKISLVHHLRRMQEKQKQLEQEGETMRSTEHENQRLRREMDAQSQLINQLKDGQYELSKHYSVALQEKDTLQTTFSKLQEQFYTTREDLQQVRMELQVALSWPTRAQCEEELRHLKEENRKLRERIELIQKAHTEGNLDTVDDQQTSDTSLQSNQELLAELSLANEKLSAKKALEMLWENEKKSMQQNSHNLQLDCDTLKQKNEAFQNQLSELKKERDQAYRARDMVQTDVSNILSEKDSLRLHVMELTDKNSKLSQQIQSLQLQLNTNQVRRSLHESSGQSSPISGHMRLVRMYAVCPEDQDATGATFEPWPEKSCQRSSDLEQRFQSYSSLQEDDFLTDLTKRSAPRRRYACRITSRETVLAFQGDEFLKQISIIGGNETGIFIHQVTPGSAADEMSLMPGYQIMTVAFDVLNPSYKVALEGMTSEDAHCILNRVNGFCRLSVRCNIDDYRKLLCSIESGSASSGDSFYVRVNQSMPGRVGGGLNVTCGEILHITDTMYKGRYQWFAHRVNPYYKKDGESGIIPNYPQAQQQLITSIQHLTWQYKTHQMPKKQVRILSTDRCNSHLLWTSLECGTCRCQESPAGSVLGRSCFTLMPYTVVTNYKTAIPRPVLFVPTLLGRILREKLCASKDFMKCDTESLSDAEYAARYQRSDIIGEKEGEAVRCCYTRQNVECVAQQNAHCILELGLSCVSALLRVGIYPIIIHIPLTEKSSKKLKKPLQWWRNYEDLLLECAQREEAELDSLPCLYRTVDSDSWNDMDSLHHSVVEAIMDEQKRIVWLEKKPC
ncbi:hypothetical protein GDO86_014103 [Hymenochirus boettgeri]|uniref:CARD domain-containing protein n=1 Tax=Hymenochirus boettgeri TaxID=247094 RepID=A0A8T2JRR2_9PIPI|nr:hypothetical protein GDO86_014103 [Hymenochirus boettgeri]